MKKTRNFVVVFVLTFVSYGIGVWKGYEIGKAFDIKQEKAAKVLQDSLPPTK